MTSTRSVPGLVWDEPPVVSAAASLAVLIEAAGGRVAFADAEDDDAAAWFVAEDGRYALQDGTEVDAARMTVAGDGRVIIYAGGE